MCMDFCIACDDGDGKACTPSPNPSYGHRALERQNLWWPSDVHYLADANKN